MIHKITAFETTRRIVAGPGSVNQISDEVKRLGGTRVMIVTDPGLVQSGIVSRVEELLAGAGLATACFSRVEPDPRYEIVTEAAELCRKENSDLVLGIGGGSSLDIAKLCSVLVTNSDPVTSYFGIDMIPEPGLKKILIPTTAGTGSEVTPIAILSDHHEKLKKGVVSRYLFPECALMDPELTVGLPPAVTAATGMDALIHAIESYTSKNAVPMTDMLACQAIELLFNNIRTAYADGANLEARSKMLEGSLLAGMAFANAGVTAVHAFAYPIGAEFHIPHGIANAIMLAPVMQFNLLGNIDKFAGLAGLLGQNTAGLSKRRAAQAAAEAVQELAADLDVPQRLDVFGVRDEHVPALAQGVMKVTRLLANNPRNLRVEDAEAIYRLAL